MALYLSELLNYNVISCTREINFAVHIYIFCPPFFWRSQEKFVKCSHKRKEDKFSDSQIFHFEESSKSSQYILLAFGLLSLLFLQHTTLHKKWSFPSRISSFFVQCELYKIVRVSVICCSKRACSKCAMMRPRFLLVFFLKCQLWACSR